MHESTTRLCAVAVSALFVGALLTGCSGDSSGDTDSARTPSVGEAPAESGVSTAPAPSPSLLDLPEVRARVDAAKGATDRPSESEAQQEVLRVAQEMYPEAHFLSVDLKAIGRDSQGRWWVQAWTPLDWGEGEQWFLIRAENGWVYVSSGTGLERWDMSSDIEWEDVP